MPGAASDVVVFFFPGMERSLPRSTRFGKLGTSADQAAPP